MGDDGGRISADEPRDTAENCAKECSQIPECDSFSFDPFNVEGSKCVKYSGGLLEASQQGQISAWCPKGSY